jgi:hypothetical protein
MRQIHCGEHSQLMNMLAIPPCALILLHTSACPTRATQSWVESHGRGDMRRLWHEFSRGAFTSAGYAHTRSRCPRRGKNQNHRPWSGCAAPRIRCAGYTWRLGPCRRTDIAAEYGDHTCACVRVCEQGCRGRRSRTMSPPQDLGPAPHGADRPTDSEAERRASQHLITTQQHPQ